MRLCETIIHNLAELIKNLRRKTNPSQKRSPYWNLHLKRGIADNTEKDTQARI